MPLDLIATSAFGLESVVARELTQLGYEPAIIQSGRVLFQGDESAICRANLWLRVADRVLVRLGTFAARDFGELFDRTHALPWHEWIGPQDEFPVNGRSIKSQLSSVPACQKIVKKAIVEKLREAHRVDALPETGVKYAVEVALLKDEATLTLDTSGPGLHKRGYRTLVGAAPLKETLAAALVLLSRWTPQRPFADPFCGSGTIAVEAALIGRNIAPGSHRTFASREWPRVADKLWHAAGEEARQLALPDLPARIIATDLDEQALSLARYHAEQAGVAEDIHFQQRSFADLRARRDYGHLVSNLPYGDRVGDPASVAALYRSLPDVLRRLPTWSFYLLTSHPQFEELVGQQADRRRKLYNARIECTFYQFHGPKRPRPGQPASEADTVRSDGSLADDPTSNTLAEGPATTTQRESNEAIALSSTPIPAKPARAPKKQAFGGLSAKSLEQAELFRSRLTKLARHLRRWPTRQGITCYRLYERDIPEIPLVVDRYEQWLHIAEFERPHDRTPAEHSDWLDLMLRTAAETLDVPRDHVFLKRRQRQRGQSQYERFGEQGTTAVVGEGGLKFKINLSDYLDTGLFLDHRQTRAMVRGDAAGRRFLNLFAYTGAFSVYAAAGGAASTTTLDWSNTYLDWARKNFALNDLDGPQHQFVREDAAGFVASLRNRDLYDLAVIDPPTFSNSKRSDEVWDVQRDHAALLQSVLRVLSPGGVIYFSTNSRRFKFDETALSGATFREITRQTIPPDFRNKRIHRAWRIVRE